MPSLLFRSMLMDLLRLIGLTAGVLVTVIAFGATIKPLASDVLLDGWQTAKYLVLAIIPMLQFALPFAAGFGATLCLHRLSIDNEVQAMAVSGLSYLRILRPLLVLGLVLTALMVALTQEVIPRFWTLLNQTLATDITKVFQASIMRGESFELGDLRIYAADMAVKQSPEGDLGPETRMVLLKVAAAELDDDRRVITDVTASQAVVDIYRREGRTYLKLVMSDTVGFDAAAGRLVRVDEYRPPRAFVLPTIFRDDLKAMTRGQLLALRRNPDDFAQVIEARDGLIETVRHIEVRSAINQQLRRDNRIELAAPRAADGPRRIYVVNAERLRGGRLHTTSRDRIEVLQFEDDAPVRRFLAAGAELVPASVDQRGLPTFDLHLLDFEVTDLRASAQPNQRAELTLPGLTIAGAPDTDYAAWPTARLVEHAASLERVDGPGESMIDRGIQKIDREITSLQHKITSRLTARYALSITAMLLLLLGALLAIWLRASMPLTVYLWAFLPSIADLILISAGEQLLKDGRAIGGPILWSGNALMFAAILWVYRNVSRN